jgi:hypothetical protein
MPKKRKKEIIKKIREEILSGKTKYSVAKELGISDKFVYYHTKDIPSGKTGRSEIRGKTLKLLKQLLKDGYAYGKKHTSSQFRTLRKHFPEIKRAEFDRYTIYYLDNKNKVALQAMVNQKKSKLISYRELGNMSKIFNINLQNYEKNRLLGKNNTKDSHKN